jgi:hypothetical protein
LTSTKSRWSASWDAIITVAVALQDGGGDMAVASEGGDEEEEDGDAAEACRRHCCWCMLLIGWCKRSVILWMLIKKKVYGSHR